MATGNATEGRVACNPCELSWRLPEISPDVRRAISALYRAGQPITAILEIRRATDFGLAPAKKLMEHMTILPGKCHRCRGVLASGGIITCGHCHELNLDW